MPSRQARLLFMLALAGLPSYGQLVISASSGTVDCVEGRVFLDDRAVTLDHARFPGIANGSILRTSSGKAEILLTPGVFLRLGENSAVRMLSNRLTDTQVEILGGSAIVRSADIVDGDSVAVIYRQHQIRLAGRGCYRLDSSPPQLSVASGATLVTFNGATTSVARSQTLLFSPGVDANVVASSGSIRADAFTRWSNQRDKVAARYLAEGHSGEEPARGWKKHRPARVYPLAPAGFPRRTW